MFWLTDDPICLSGSRWSDINARCKRSLSVLFRPRRLLLNCQSALNCLSVLLQPQRSFPCLLCSRCLKSRSGAYGQHVACRNKWYSRRAYFDGFGLIYFPFICIYHRSAYSQHTQNSFTNSIRSLTSQRLNLLFLILASTFLLLAPSTVRLLGQHALLTNNHNRWSNFLHLHQKCF